jgi:hypothetical protein
MMARAATRPLATHSGLYAWLADREERTARNGFQLSGVEQTGCGAYSYRGTPDRLAALGCGEPVDIRAADLPAWARVGVVCRWWTRAVVGPDNTVTFRDDDGSRWLAENGL